MPHRDVCNYLVIIASSTPVNQCLSTIMCSLEIVGIVLLACTPILADLYGHHGHRGFQSGWNDERMVKEVFVKQGRLRGLVVQPKTNSRLQLVDVFLGIPYAEPPVGPFRFSPPRSPQPWRDVRPAQEFAPVCPQLLPDLRLEVMPERHEYLERILPYLKNQSEDCLYLNIYAPHQSDGSRSHQRRYPVMVFIHGESFEWNSGNPYDGTILSAYGNVVFVTINFRLGILGFLRPGTSDDAASNFGLLDQTAALLWLRENIAKFGGDPDSVLLVGHGTGAIFANLLLMSPVANNKGLFKRAILMSGSALSADAIGKAPLQITKQVAHALNCPTTSDSDLAFCLRNRDIDSLLNVRIDIPRYVAAYAPLIDRAVVPKKPAKLMENTQLFGSFDLMYGVTQSEKFHILSPDAVLHGMFDDHRNQVLRDHAKATHELEPDLVLSKILEHYGNPQFNSYTDEYEVKNRDLVLDVLSDSGTVAPLVMTGKLHAKANPKTYMYVFSHPRAMQDYSGQQRQHTVHGEELPYILGVPLAAGKHHLRGRYNIGETLFSEAMMTWWCNFAYTGNPNAPRRTSFLTDGAKEWQQYQLDWPEYDLATEAYFNLSIPPRIGRKYRSEEMQFWNEGIPKLITHKPWRPRPNILNIADGIGEYGNDSSFRTPDVGMKYTTSVPRSGDRDSGQDGNSKQVPEESALKGSSAITMVIGFGVVFLLINVTAFFYLYRRRQSLKNKATSSTRKRNSHKKDESLRKTDKPNVDELTRKCDSKPDINDVVKSDKAYDNNSNFGRQSKLSRNNSSSTIDTHIKVKEWIQQEIVHRCSPRFLRKTRETLQREHLTKQQQQDEAMRRKHEDEKLKVTKPEPIYDHNPALTVRPGGAKSKAPKVSVAIDATPATRTESILNQIPIELVQDRELAESPYDSEFSVPQVVVIEHHHSRSDPLPMETVYKSMKPNFSNRRMYESDSGSTSSLYAKINPKMKTKLASFEETAFTEDMSSDTCDGSENPTANDGIYGRIPKLTTFGNALKEDINVTSREPIAERDNFSPEEALKTIKRRNYPKVLPDIEKRRSLPVPNSLLVSKQFSNALMDHRKGPHPSCIIGCPPEPPPRIFGTSKSLDLPEEEDEEPITTNLHVGPLLKRQDSTGKNRSDSSIIESIERVAIDAQEVLSNHRNESVDVYDSITPNPKCPVHGTPFHFSEEIINTCTSRSADGLDRNMDGRDWHEASVDPSTSIGTPNMSLPNVSLGNPNWYKTMRSQRRELRGQYIKPDDSDRVLDDSTVKIIISPKIPDLSTGGNVSSAESHLNRSQDALCKDSLDWSINADERRDPKVVIAPMGTLKQPKIIIKPSTNPQRNRERNIPKVSAIPSPEVQQNFPERLAIMGEDSIEARPEKPPIKEKPMIARMPSFTRRIEERGQNLEKSPVYSGKVEIVQRIAAIPNSNVTTTIPLNSQATLLRNESIKAESIATNSNTIKRKPANKN